MQPTGTTEQPDDHFEVHSTSLRPLHHSQRIETARFVFRNFPANNFSGGAFQVSSIPTWSCTSSPVTVYLKVSVSAGKASPTGWSTPTSSFGMISKKKRTKIVAKFLQVNRVTCKNFAPFTRQEFRRRYSCRGVVL